MVRNTYIYPPEPSMKIIGDIFEYTSKVSWPLICLSVCLLFARVYSLGTVTQHIFIHYRAFDGNHLRHLRLHVQSTQQNNYSISHLLGTVTAQWLDSDNEVTVDNCRQHGDYTVDQLCSQSRHTMLLAIVNSDYTVTVQSLCSHCA